MLLAGLDFEPLWSIYIYIHFIFTVQLYEVPSTLLGENTMKLLLKLLLEFSLSWSQSFVEVLGGMPF